MKCITCATENPPKAIFCGHCGAPLGREPVQISVFSAALGLVVLGIMVSDSVAFPLTFLKGHIYSFYSLLGVGGGVGVGLLLTLLFWRTGWFPTVVGVIVYSIGQILVPLFIVVGSLMTPPGGPIPGGVGIYPALFVVKPIASIGIGLLIPGAFWRHIRQLSTAGLVILAVAGVVGLPLGWFTSSNWFVGPIILLPLIRVPPIVRRLHRYG